MPLFGVTYVLVGRVLYHVRMQTEIWTGDERHVKLLPFLTGYGYTTHVS